MSGLDNAPKLCIVNSDDDDFSQNAETETRASGHGKLLGKLRLDRGPLRWWLLIIGLITVQFEPLRFAGGATLVICGAVLHLASKGHLRPGKRYLQRTQAITTRGPYRFVRNPFYLANLLAETGLLVIIGRPWIAAVYLSIWAWVYRKTILEEEAKLRGLCGEVYIQYCRQVPRLLPIPWRFRPKNELSGPRFSWSNPHIADGKELQRALRLISYPLLLRAVAAVHDSSSWELLAGDISFVCSAAGFLMLNGIGWLTTPLMRRFVPVERGDQSELESSPVDESTCSRRKAA